MNIGINTFAVTPKPGSKGSGGVKTFLTGVVKHLAKIDEHNHYYLYLSKANQNYFDDFIGPNFQKVLLPFDSDNKYLKCFFEQCVLPFCNLKFKIDVLFCPTNLAPLFAFTKTILGIQSMLYKLAPQAMCKMIEIYHGILLPLSVKRADKVVTVSQDIKGSIIDVLKTNPRRIEVIYEGVDLEIFKQARANKEALVKSYSCSSPYILFVSTLYEYKNVDKLIRAFALAGKKGQISQKLVIVGGDHDCNTEKLRAIARDNGIQDEVIFTGPLKIETVAMFYKNADLFVFPSSVESFGLPPLEAMASGTPVIGSNRTSVPEIIGDAGLIVDPDDINALADAILRVLSDNHLRTSLVAKGYERIRQFSWDKTAERILEIITQVHNGAKD